MAGGDSGRGHPPLRQKEKGKSFAFLLLTFALSGDPITGWRPVPLFGPGLAKQFGAQAALAAAGENHHDEPALVFGPGG